MSFPHTTIWLRRYGRTGNNIMQNIHALAYAEQFGHRVVTLGIKEILPELVFDFSQGKAEGERYIQAFYLGRPEVEGFKMTWEDREVIAKKYFSDKLLVKPIPPGDRTLTIHLRSGDIMKANTAASNYVQPPMALYRRVIQDGGFDRILVISEPDGQNPCLKPLEEFGATIVKTGVGESFAHLLGAHHLCFGISTFSSIAAVLSQSLECLYLGDGVYNSFCATRLSFSPSARFYKYTGYIQRGKWKATASQKQLMLDLPIENCVLAK